MLSAIFAAFVIYILFVLTLLILILARKQIIKWLFVDFVKILFSDEYHENITEMLPAVKHIGLLNTIENQLRSEEGHVLHRPVASIKSWPNFEPISFIPVQTTPFPIERGEAIDLSTTIGQHAKKPLRVEFPILIGGMAYGLALSKEVKIALAKASARLRTAINSGEGGILPEERQAAYKYILQFSRTAWGKDEELLANCDMIEIKLGQGATAGVGDLILSSTIPDEAKKIMGLAKDEDAIIHDTFFENQTLADLKDLVSTLREVSKGVPIGIKIMAAGHLERDLERLIKIGVDVIVLDGAQGGTHGAPPILQDDFGIPTLHGLVRAAKYLQEKKVKERISLIVGGGLRVPGDFLKALALGADAVYVGSAILFAVNHNQLLKPLPFEAPSEMVYSEGRMTEDFDIEQGAKFGANYLQACKEEMEIALRAMGKRTLKELSPADLITYDETIARMANIAFSFESMKQ